MNIQEFLPTLNPTQSAQLQPPFPTILNFRETFAKLTEHHLTTAPAMANIIDTPLITPPLFRGFCPDIRLFIPQTLSIKNQQTPNMVPVLVFFHGGGGVAGSVSIYDKIYKNIADCTGYLVVAPSYRLAPENQFPAAIDDAHNIIKHLNKTLLKFGFFADKIGLMGDNVGGAITATVLQDWLANRIETDIIIDKQILIYPILDYTLSQLSTNNDSPAVLFNNDLLHWIYQQYFNIFDDKELASPFWTDMGILSHHTPHPLPKTLLISADFCLLKNENLAYHQHLLDAGFDSQWVNFTGMPNSFLNLENLYLEHCQTLYHAIADFCQT